MARRKSSPRQTAPLAESPARSGSVHAQTAHPTGAASATTPDATGPIAWRKDVNTYYQKVIDLLISLATGALILPPIFLQTYVGVKDEPLLIFLDGWEFASTGFFVLTSGSGIALHYTSAKWLKRAWGQRTMLSARAIERWMDWLFWAAVIGFLAGIACFLQFIVNV
jgi:hypothetical protein